MPWSREKGRAGILIIYTSNDWGVPEALMMSRKRISSRDASSIAARRMSVLFGLSRKALEEGNRDRAKRYVMLARRIGQRTRTPIPKEHHFCKKCNMPLDVGKNCRVRVKDGVIRITCLECGDIRRMPYTKESRE